MRRALGLFCCLLVWITSQKLAAQSDMIRYEEFRSTPLAEAFHRLELSYGLRFNYSEEQVRNKVISAKIYNRPIEEAVNLLLAGTDLRGLYNAERRVVVIQHISQASSETSPGILIKGRITDWETQGGLMAGIQDTVSKKGVWANALGYFSLYLKHVEPEIVLAFRHLGYQNHHVRIDPANPPRNLQIRLKSNPVEISKVMIARKQEPPLAMHTSTTELELRPQKFGPASGLGENDMMRTLQLMPGVNSTQESASELYVRGGTPAHNLLLFDGMTMYQPGHFFGMVGAFNTDAIDEVRLQRGGFGARYGGRLSSVIEVQTRPQKPDSIRLGVGMNALNGKFLMEVPFWKSGKEHKAAFLLAARRSTTDLLQSWLYQGIFEQVFQQGLISDNQAYLKSNNFHQIQTFPRFAFGDLNTKLIFQPGDKDHISISTFGGFDRLSYQTTLQRDQSEALFRDHNQLKLGNLGTSGKWKREWTQHFHTETDIAYSSFQQSYEYASEVHFSNDPGYMWDYSEKNRIQDLALRQHFNWEANPAHVLEGGWQLNRLSTKHQQDFYAFGLDGLDTTDQRIRHRADSAHLYHSYVQYSYQPKTPLSLKAGLRHTYFSRTNQHYLAPRVSLRFALTDRWALKAAYGQYRQFISRIEVPNQLRVGEDFWILADGDSIPVSSSQHIITGISYQTKDMLLDVELYHKELTDLTTYTQEYYPSGRELQNGFLVNEGTGKAIGIDLLFKKTYSIPGGTFTGLLGYSLSQVMYTFPQIESGRSFFADHDQRHSAKWVNTLNLGRWNFNSTWTFASGLPFTPATGIQSSAHARPQHRLILTFGPRNSDRLPVYHRLDLSASYKFSFLSDRRQGNIGISVFNVYNRRNVKSRYFVGMVFPDEEEIEPQLLPVDRLLLGFSPNLFLNLNF